MAILHFPPYLQYLRPQSATSQISTHILPPFPLHAKPLLMTMMKPLVLNLQHQTVVGRSLCVCSYKSIPHRQRIRLFCSKSMEADKLSENSGHTNGGHKISAEKMETLLRVKKLSPNAILPSRGSSKAAGYDLSSASACVVPARGKSLVQSDLSIAIPENTYARIAPRSGLAWKHSIDVGAGVIDADYRGPVGVILFNHSDQDFEVKAGDRIAQLILEQIVTPGVLEVEDLDATTRGAGGFGSTGV